MVRATVAAARGSRAADGGRRSQRPIRGGRCRARARRAVGVPVLDAPAPAAARHRDRRNDDAGDGSPPRADPDQSDLSRRWSYRSAFATAFHGCSGEPRCVPTSRSRSTSSARGSASTTSTSSRTSEHLVRRRPCSTRRSGSSKGSSCARSSRRSATARARAATARALAVIDRTYVCATSILGGIYELKSRAHSGVRSGTGWAKLPCSGAEWGLGGSADRAAERSRQHARLDHRRCAVRIDHRRRRQRGVPGARGRDPRRKQRDVPAVEREVALSAPACAAALDRGGGFSRLCRASTSARSIPCHRGGDLGVARTCTTLPRDERSGP